MANEKFGKWEFSEEEILQTLEAAARRGEEELSTEPQAKRVEFDRVSNMIFVYLKNESLFAFPPTLIKELKNVSLDEIAKVTITPLGDALHWDELDAHYTLVGLLNGVFGTKAWMKEVGRKGGRVSSNAKAIAARVNGARGGRPRKEVYEHSQEIRCDFCDISSSLKGKRFVSPKLQLSSLYSLNELDVMADYITDPIERRNRRIVDVPIPSYKESSQVVMNKVKVLGLEN